MTFVWKTLLATITATTAVAFTAIASAAPALVWNASASVPVGLYRVQPTARLKVSDLVVVRPPEELARFLASNGYLPRGVPLLKRIAASMTAAAVLCRSGRAARCSGRIRSSFSTQTVRTRSTGATSAHCRSPASWAGRARSGRTRSTEGGRLASFPAMLPSVGLSADRSPGDLGLADDRQWNGHGRVGAARPTTSA